LPELTGLPKAKVEQRLGQVGTIGGTADGRGNQITPENDDQVKLLPAIKFQPLFDGKSLDGWHGDKAWYVTNGEIIGQMQGGDPQARSYLSTKDSYRNFILKARFKVKDGDSGILFRGKPNWLHALQVLIGTWKPGSLMDESPRERNEPLRMIVDDPNPTGPWAGERFIKKNEWNDFTLTVDGDKLRCEINGQLAFNAEYADGPRTGVISLKVRGDTHVAFKDIEIARLPETESRVPSPTPSDIASRPPKEIVTLLQLEHFVDGQLHGTNNLLSNGHINQTDSRATWSFNGRILLMRWPGAGFVDRCVIARDGKTLDGENNKGTQIHERIISGNVKSVRMN
jgi:hypothetical protein